MMKKLSMPINFISINEGNKGEYLYWLKKCKADRVFLCGLGNIYQPTSFLKTNTQTVKNVISYFKQNGVEVGVWVDGFGHGSTLFGADGENSKVYTQIEGVDGKTSEHAFCPEDEEFANDYKDAIKLLATLSPDLIMLDDDFRFNVRSRFYNMGCFCKNHLKIYYELLGEEIPREKIKELAFTGGKNKYRDAYYDMLASSLLKFSKNLRQAVDEVNPQIRLGASYTCESWDSCGSDIFEIARALAGNTRPFARLAGAPYWNNNIIRVVEISRMSCEWAKNNPDVEIFFEGDLYPRPKYNVPYKPFELFDLILLANGKGDGMLAYLFDYNQKPDYETGYLSRYVKGLPLRDSVEKIFKNKTPVGVRVFNQQKKARNLDLPTKLVRDDISRVVGEEFAFTRNSFYVLSNNSIPTSYEKGDYPVYVCGEDAKYIDLDALSNGAILDVKSAQILQSRGVDTGLISATPCSFVKEYFEIYDDAIPGIEHTDTQKIEINAGAVLQSVFLPSKTPASYRYENANGQRFFVMAFDGYSYNNNYSANYFNNYYRQAQLKEAIEWACKKKLPAFVAKNTYTYLLTAKGENDSLAIAVANVYLDDIYNLEIELDKKYSKINCIGATAKLCEDKIVVEHISPYGFVAIELE